MPWLPYLLGTRITAEVPLDAESVEGYLDRSLEALQERGFIPRSSSGGVRTLDAPDVMSRVLNNLLPGCNTISLRAQFVRNNTIRFTYDVRHLREFAAVIVSSLAVLLGSTDATMLLTIPLLFGIAWLIPYFYHIDHFKRIVKGPRDPFKHLRDRH
jgi:hypothetical protein